MDGDTPIKWLLTLILLLGFGPAQALPDIEPPPTEVVAVQSDPWGELPANFRLAGRVVDERGDPASGVAIYVRQSQVATTDRAGRFVLAEPISPSTWVEFRHPQMSSLSRQAGYFYAGENRETVVELFALRHVFKLTPAGGEFRAGGIYLRVPEGAVTEAVTVYATRLPLDLAYDDSADLQIQRLGAVEFGPEGLRFNKPVDVAIDLDYGGPSSEGSLLLFDEGKERFAPQLESVRIVDGQARFRLDHFSRRAVGDPAGGIVRKHIARSNDINGDNKLTSEDADFVILLSGGTQSAEFTIDIEEATTVSKSTSKGSHSGSSSSASAGGGIEIGGAGIDVSHTVSRETSSDLVKKAGLERSASTSTSTTDRLQAGEYELKCKYYTGIYDFYLVEVWSRHQPSAVELEALEDAYAKRSDQEAEWSRFVWNRPTSIALNRTLYGETHLAIRQGPKGLEIYRLADSYVVKKRFATYPVDCKPGNMQQRIDRAKKGASDPGQAASNMKDHFKFFGGGDAQSGYQGWGVLPESDVLLKIGQECGNESEGEYILTSSVSASEEEEKSTSTDKSSQTEAKVSGGASVGPVKIGAEVSAASGSSSGKSEAKSYASNLMSKATTRVHWHIINAHDFHYSDHLVAPLHNIKKVGDQMIKRPIGLMVLRYNEYPCPTYTPTGETPRSTPPPSTEPDGGGAPPPPAVTPGAANNARSAPAGQPVITPSGDRAAGQSKAPQAEDEANAALPSQGEAIHVVFSGLSGETHINRALIGQPRGIEVVGLAAEDLRADDVAASATGEAIVIRVRREIPDAVLVVSGDKSQLTISAIAEKEPEPPPEDRSRRIVPLGGMLVSVGGLLEGTLRLPEEAVETSGSPGAYGVELGGRPLDVVALRGNELAVRATDISAPAAGREEISLTTPSGAEVVDEVGFWSYHIEPQPVAHLEQWAPIAMQCSGLDAKRPLQVTFTPHAGQTIEPETQVVDCASLSAPREIARYRTSVLGEQPLNVQVRPLQP